MVNVPNLFALVVSIIVSAIGNFVYIIFIASIVNGCNEIGLSTCGFINLAYLFIIPVDYGVWRVILEPLINNLD
jgi:hypothetical protein